MNEAENQTEPNDDAKLKRRVAIEQMWLYGRSPHEIVIELAIDPHTVGQNLRAIRRRYAKRLAISLQQQRAEGLAHYGSIYREAMHGWRQSLADKKGTATTKVEDDPVKKVERVENRTGNFAFLATAMRARRAIDAIYAGKGEGGYSAFAAALPTQPLTKPPELLEAHRRRVRPSSRHRQGDRT